MMGREGRHDGVAGEAKAGVFEDGLDACWECESGVGWQGTRRRRGWSFPIVGIQPRIMGVGPAYYVIPM